jgi:hypothetical protein
MQAWLDPGVDDQRAQPSKFLLGGGKTLLQECHEIISRVLDRRRVAADQGLLIFRLQKRGGNIAHLVEVSKSVLLTALGIGNLPIAAKLTSGAPEFLNSF